MRVRACLCCRSFVRLVVCSFFGSLFVRLMMCVLGCLFSCACVCLFGLHVRSLAGSFVCLFVCVVV